MDRHTAQNIVRIWAEIEDFDHAMPTHGEEYTELYRKLDNLVAHAIRREMIDKARETIGLVRIFS